MSVYRVNVGRPGTWRQGAAPGVKPSALDAAALRALPDGEAVVLTSGGVPWIKGDGDRWHRPEARGQQKVRDSAWLAQTSPTLIHPNAS